MKGIRSIKTGLDSTSRICSDEDDFRWRRRRQIEFLESVLCSFIQWIFIVVQGRTCQKQGI